MMRRIISFTRDKFDYLKKHLVKGKNVDEEAAFLICGVSESEEKIMLLVRDVITVPDDALISKGRSGLTINPDFMSRVIKRCRLENLSIVLTHSHPFSIGKVYFSGIDDFGEKVLFPKIQSRVPEQHHAAMVFGQSGLDARIWLRGQSSSECIDQVKVIGNHIEIYVPTSSQLTSAMKPENIYTRQILAFTEEGQKKIQQTKVGIVGLGGIGSQVFQQLVHLGVKELILVDRDQIEESNHNRVVGATWEDIKLKRPKVEIMERLGKGINPKVDLQTIQGDICIKSVAQHLRNADVIFGCTDNMASRMVLTRIAPQYLIPVIDLGIDIQLMKDGKIRRIGGHVIILYPDGPCLNCLEFIDHEQLNYEISRYNGNIHFPYIQGDNENAPSVISLNGVLASLAVTDFIYLVTGCFNVPKERTYRVFDGVKGIVKKINMMPTRDCNLCTEIRALGDSIDFPSFSDK